MKEFIINFCVAVLRKTGASVIINFDVEGDLHAKNRFVRLYDMDQQGSFYTEKGTKITIPYGKFKYEWLEEERVDE